MRQRSLVRLVSVMAALAPAGLVAGVAANGSQASATAVSILHPPAVASTPGIRHDNVEFLNWSGYAVSSATEFTDAAGSWVEPTATCPSRSTTYGSFWVGIDGYSSGSVEQLGTDSDCVRGTPSYYAWYEMYPANSVTLSSAAYPVKAGDTLTGGVARSGTSYTLSLTDTENGLVRWTYSTVQAASDANSSAEWVAEAPELCSFVCRLASLTDFGTVTFSEAQAAAGGALAPISSFSASGGPHDMTMVTNTGTIKAQPSALAPGGEGFSDTWYHS